MGMADITNYVIDVMVCVNKMLEVNVEGTRAMRYAPAPEYQRMAPSHLEVLRYAAAAIYLKYQSTSVVASVAFCE